MAVTAVATGRTSDTAGGQKRLRALHQRLGAAAETLGIDRRQGQADPAVETSELFGLLVEHAHQREDAEPLWLLLTALSATLQMPPV